MNSINKYYSEIKNIEIEQIPQITNPVLDVFAKHVNCAFKPKNMDLNLKGRMSELNKMDQVIEKAKNSNTFHKVMSICLLAATVSMMVAGTILTFAVNPLYALLTAGAILSSITAQYLDDKAFRDPNVSRHGGYALPIIEEAIYIADAFGGTKRLEKQMNAKLEPLNERLEMLKKLLENHPIIRQGIQKELQQMDLTKDNVDINRIIQLKSALYELNKATVLIEKIKN
jgi:hypothetical protein